MIQYQELWSCCAVLYTISLEEGKKDVLYKLILTTVWEVRLVSTRTVLVLVRSSPYNSLNLDHAFLYST